MVQCKLSGCCRFLLFRFDFDAADGGNLFCRFFRKETAHFPPEKRCIDENADDHEACTDTRICFCLCGFFIFTMGFSIYFVILGSASILITGLFSIPVYTSLYKNELINKDRMICYCILSFVFCADVVVAVRCYRQVKGRGDN